jgi:hypothetical protein
MLIVDSQVHIWGADTLRRLWPKRAEPQRPVPLVLAIGNRRTRKIAAPEQALWPRDLVYRRDPVAER